MANPNPHPPQRFSKEHRATNPGNIKGTRHLKTIIREILEMKHPNEAGEKLENMVIMVKAIIDKAKDGDVTAFKAIAERLEGMPEQHIKTEDVTPDPLDAMSPQELFDYAKGLVNESERENGKA